MIKCEHCSKEVMPVKSSFAWVWFILLFIFTGGIGAVIYLIYYLSKKPVRCPVCGKNAYE